MLKNPSFLGGVFQTPHIESILFRFSHLNLQQNESQENHSWVMGFCAPFLPCPSPSGSVLPGWTGFWQNSGLHRSQEGQGPLLCCEGGAQAGRGREGWLWGMGRTVGQESVVIGWPYGPGHDQGMEGWVDGSGRGGKGRRVEHGGPSSGNRRGGVARHSCWAKALVWVHTASAWRCGDCRSEHSACVGFRSNPKNAAQRQRRGLLPALCPRQRPQEHGGADQHVRQEVPGALWQR